MALTVGQAIGIGFAAGFVAAIVVVAVLLCLPDKPSSYITKVSSDEPVRSHTGIPQEVVSETLAEQLARRRPDPVRDTVRRFPARMDTLQGLGDIREAVHFENCIRSLVDLFKLPQHCQPHVPESLFDEDELVRLAGKPINGGTWSESISNKATRASALKCFLAQFIFKRINPNGPPQESLLPPEIASCYQFVCTPHENPRSHKQRIQADKSAGEDLAGIWRESMFLLLQAPLSLWPLPAYCFKEGDPRKERTHAMVPVIMDALHLKSLKTLPQFDGGIERGLQGMLQQAANSALHLLAQPAEWEAVWVATKPGFIVFPEIRFVWDGFTKFSKPAVVDADIAWPMPSDDEKQPDDDQQPDNNQQPEVDASEQPKLNDEKLPSPEDGHPVALEAGQEPGPSTAKQ
ncbi:hypothetical protein N0V84_011027 [Fusarium piperis]|uniref:Uncharacterized protein n=1 Tax=Fusarium piperis TaxID=1435070 RepID=A0A9W8W129_9HYPO|nr:hypothetical protein N0V84_011027 [Fusarium piperis]